MTPQTASQNPLTIKAYLSGEQDGDLRHEYVGGKIYAMTGGLASLHEYLLVDAVYEDLEDVQIHPSAP